MRNAQNQRHGVSCQLCSSEHSALPAAWKSGVTLQHVKLKVEAFDYLQLPVDIKEGVVGRLQVQVQCCSSVLLCHSPVMHACAAHKCYTHTYCTAIALPIWHVFVSACREHVLHAGAMASVHRTPAANCAV
jgi:N-terminal region of Chorein or VPS13